MVNLEALAEMDKLMEEYREKWNQPIDMDLIPPYVTQEKACLILRQIVETGDSVLTGIEKIKKTFNQYYHGIDWTIQYKTDDIMKEPCPFCKEEVKIEFFGEYGQSYIIYCKTPRCMRLISQGL